jgi:hypothetical protein
MDFLDKKISEVNKLNEESIKDETKEEDKKQNKGNLNIFEKIQSKISSFCFFICF